MSEIVAPPGSWDEFDDDVSNTIKQFEGKLRSLARRFDKIECGVNTEGVLIWPVDSELDEICPFYFTMDWAHIEDELCSFLEDRVDPHDHELAAECQKVRAHLSRLVELVDQKIAAGKGGK